jgi:hypothetical protein
MAFSEANPKPLVACWASAGVGNTEGTGSPVGSVPRNGLPGDLPEADFWPGITSGLSVTRDRSVASAIGSFHNGTLGVALGFLVPSAHPNYYQPSISALQQDISAEPEP